MVPQIFREDHGDGIGFFAGGTARDPKAQRAMLGVAILQNGGKDDIAEGFESFGIAEKTGDVDEHVAVKLVEFVGVFLDVGKIIFEGFETVQDHAALDAALERGLFIFGEVHAGGLPQYVSNVCTCLAAGGEWEALSGSGAARAT